jgi:L-malate glycosyltransferase
MRILLVAPEDERVGGVPHVIGNLALHLRRQGHEVIFLYSGTGFLRKTKINKWGFTGFEIRLQMPLGERHPVVSILAFLALFPIGLYQLIRLIRRYKIQVVNIHYPDDCFCYFALCRRMLPLKVVVSVHGTDFFPDGRPRSAYTRASKFLLSAADRVVAPSRAYLQDFRQVFPQLKQKMTFIYNGVDLEELRQPEEDKISCSGMPYMLCIAQHVQKKGLDVLLYAFRRLHDQGLPHKMIFVGDGPLRRQLEELARSLGISAKVEFLGGKGRTEVMTLLYGCELLVLPSRSEPFGIALIEAMACKKPVVATKIGGIPEIVDNGGNGILVEPDDPTALADALLTILTDATLAMTIANRGHAMVRERFTVEHTGAAYEKLFARLLTDRVQEQTSCRASQTEF